MADFHAVVFTNIQGDDRIGPAFSQAAVDTDDASGDVLLGTVRHIGNDLRLRSRSKAVATGNFFLGQGNAHHRGLTRLDQAGVAEEEGFVGDDLAGFRILQRLALAEDVPFNNGSIRDAAGVEGVAGADQHAVFLHGDDLHACIEFAVFNDQWLRNEGFDGPRRNAGNDLLDGRAMDGGLQLAGAAAGVADPFAKLEAR